MAQDLNVLVLDALDGEPQANVKVAPFCAGPPRSFPKEGAFTNEKGIATISYVCTEKQAIEIEVVPPDKKEQCDADAKTNFNDATSIGFISDSSSATIGGMWCPTKMGKDLKPVPGQVIMFVKKPTWRQSHVAGE